MARHGTRSLIRTAALLLGAFWAGPTTALPDAGAYLAGQAAAGANDFTAAARWFEEARAADPANAALIENLIGARLSSGDFDTAVPVAREARAAGLNGQIVNMVLAAEAARTDRWAAIFDAHEAGHEVGPLVDGLTRGWAYAGLGEMGEALMAFDEVIETPGLRGFGLYHKALALASAGDFGGAEAILSLPPEDGLPRNRRGVIALAQVMAQQGRAAEAVAMLDETFGPAPDDLTLTGLRADLATGTPVPFSLVPDARTGLAEVYYTVASVLGDETPVPYVLLFARTAQALAPADPEITILVAELLTEVENFALSSAAYATVPRDDPAFFSAELGRAEALRRGGQTSLAIEVLQQLLRAYPEQAMAHITLGDALRREERFAEANESYSRAIELMDPRDPRLWFVFYMRGIGHHQLDTWPEAEADFRSALALNPGQAQVLNYLGYSLVERREKLDEALAMIETAVAAQPQNGAIVDSLGWALFVLGRAEEAVEPMERAAELEPVDPIVLDHLGDVYWTVGRRLEARFQWQRALSFEPEPDEALRIRRKLEVGLDRVLEEEAGAEPAVAQDLCAMATGSAIAPATITITLHVTGQRPDGYHMLDSLVVFGVVGDRITATAAPGLSLEVSGPFAAGVPTDASNSILRAAARYRARIGGDEDGPGAHLRLTKALPHAAGIGSGSSDAAATLALLSELWGRPPLGWEDPDVLALGADVPVCRRAPQPVRMEGIGERLGPVPALPRMAMVLINPRVPVPTAEVFRTLARRDNAPMQALPEGLDFAGFCDWLAEQRNDLQGPAEVLAPEIGRALAALRRHPSVRAAVMSGSGATCVGLVPDIGTARQVARVIQVAEMGWWVVPADVLGTEDATALLRPA